MSLLCAADYSPALLITCNSYRARGLIVTRVHMNNKPGSVHELKDQELTNADSIVQHKVSPATSIDVNTTWEVRRAISFEQQRPLPTPTRRWSYKRHNLIHLFAMVDGKLGWKLLSNIQTKSNRVRSRDKQKHQSLTTKQVHDSTYQSHNFRPWTISHHGGGHGFIEKYSPCLVECRKNITPRARHLRRICVK
jgi:hypothetical protein